VGFYHSVIDWHHPEYDFTKAKGLPYPENGTKDMRKRDHAKYVDFLHQQVDELTSNYGKVDVLCWDYRSTEFDGDEAWRAFDLISEVRKKQPDIIMNNRLFRRPEAGFTGMSTRDVSNKMDTRYGDFVTPENHIPATGLPGVDWETCMTMNTSWGYSEHDHAWKSSQQIIRNLIDIASKGGNYLINVGPMADGTIPSESVERMQAVGAWLAKNGESIHGTTASPFEELGFDGRCTAKGEVLFLHVFKRSESGVIEIPATKQAKATLIGGEELKAERVNGSLRIHLPASLPDPVASVIRVE
jgi:alpha-L-fucosidase